MASQIEYKPSRTVAAFLEDDSVVKAIIGPYGSGKSTGCIVDLYKWSFVQEPDVNGVRRTRFLIIRNTIPQLKATTIKSCLSMFPDGVWGTWKEAEKTFVLGTVGKRAGSDGDRVLRGEDWNGKRTWVESEWVFRSLDKPGDEANLLSMNLTGIWMNEFRELPYQYLPDLIARVGRYPRGMDLGWNDRVTEQKRSIGVDACTRKGIILDSNPFEPDSPYMGLFLGDDDVLKDAALKAGIEVPKFTLHQQPSGLSPEAENVENLPAGYYHMQEAMARRTGRSEGWINAHIHGRLAFYNSDSRSVYGQSFNETAHIAKDFIRHNPGSTTIVGFDPGHNSAAVVLQKDTLGRWLILSEVFEQNMSGIEFARVLGLHLRERFNLSPQQVVVIADPAVEVRSQYDMKSVKDALQSSGFRVYKGEKSQVVRRDSVKAALARMVAGTAGFIIDPRCKMLIRGFLGAYRYEKIRKAGDIAYKAEPEKNDASHVHDALQYPISYVEGPMLRGLSGRPIPTIRDSGQLGIHKMNTNWSPF